MIIGQIPGGQAGDQVVVPRVSSASTAAGDKCS